MYSELVEARNKLEAKRAELAKVFQEGKTSEGPNTLDMSKVTCLGEGLTTVAKAERIKAMNDEMSELGKEVERLSVVEQAAANLKRRENTTGLQIPSPELEEQERKEKKDTRTLGQQFVESKAFKAYAENGNKITGDSFKGSLKTLLSTAAGWAPEVTRIERVIDLPLVPIQFSDLMPSETTTQSAVSYMQQKTFTNNAAETAEGAPKPEAALEWEPKTVVVETIAVWIPVTNQQLEDVPRIQGLVDNLLGFMLRQRLDAQAVNGNGVTPNLLGLLNVPNILTQAKGADPTPDAVRKAMTQVRVTGQANPNFAAFHPNDWQDIRLLRTVDGIYIWGSPSEAGPERIWGIRAVEAQGLPEGTGATGDANFCAKVMRSEVDIQLGYINDDFTRNQKTVRGEMRVALVWYRPKAFASITGI